MLNIYIQRNVHYALETTTNGAPTLRRRCAAETASGATKAAQAEARASEEEACEKSAVTSDQHERIDALEARLIALQIALGHLLHDASPETRAAIGRSADVVQDQALSFELTDDQIDQIQQLLRSMS